jgi:hypothetical protein
MKDKPQVEIVREGHAQRIFIDGYELTNVVSYKLESGMEFHPEAHLTLTILCQVKEQPDTKKADKK